MNFVVELGVPQFHRLAKLANQQHKRANVERAFCARASQADKKGWSEFMKIMGERKVGTGEDLARMLNAQRVLGTNRPVDLPERKKRM